ncbi:MAG TPA: hypothetical protein PKY82_33300 [Pyrinomonadaceae bacterium]|nr:hypothetical protein [Pyrinomonadaceae bacterium]
MKRIKCFLLEPTEKTIPREVFNDDGKKIADTEDTVWRRTDTGEEFRLQERPVGAMWFAPWYDGAYCQPQLDHVLVVHTPGGVWVVDSQASNCTMPEDHKQENHHCWIIEGQLPNITVSKNGKTCGAGAGSIQCGNYHGFLRNGYLEEC